MGNNTFWLDNFPYYIRKVSPPSSLHFPRKIATTHADLSFIKLFPRSQNRQTFPHCQGKVDARLRQGQGKVRARSEKGQGKVRERSSKGHQGKVKAKSVWGQSKVKGRSAQFQGNIKAKFSPCVWCSERWYLPYMKKFYSVTGSL